MLAGVHITCFAASYSVALALEVSRLLFRSGVRGAVMLGFGAAGLVAHSAFLYHRAIAATGSPLSSSRDWCLLVAWLLVVVYLYLSWFHPGKHFGLFVLPLVLGLIAAATWMASDSPFGLERAAMVWGIIHGIAILLATVAVLVAFVAGLMYLGQAQRLKGRQPTLAGLRLPSLEWLQQTGSRAIVVAALALGLGILAGVVLNLVQLRHGVGRLPWYDPVVLTTLGMFGWLLATAVFNAAYRGGLEGRKVAWLTIASFVFLLLAMGLFIATKHGSRKEALQIENCRLQIANCMRADALDLVGLSHHRNPKRQRGMDAGGETVRRCSFGPSVSLTSGLADASGCDGTAIFNFQFSIFNLQSPP